MEKVLMIPTNPICHDGLTKVIQNIITYLHDDFEFGIVLFEQEEQEFSDFFSKYHVRKHYSKATKKHVKKYMDEIKRIVLEGNYNIVHVHGNSALMYFAVKAAKNAGAQVRIAHCHNSSTEHPLVHHLIKPAFNRITTVKIGCSKKAAEWAYDQDYVIIKNGVELDQYTFSQEIRDVYREKLGIKDEFLVGHIGRFSMQKNHKFLIEIFNEILKQEPNAKLLLIGDGELEESVKEQVKALHLEDHVIFYGLTHHVKEFMQAMDVFLLPSLYEGLPIVGVEAQASGLNMVTSDTVSEELKMTSLVHYVPLTNSAKEWANEVLKYKGCPHEDDRAELRACGYDLKAAMQAIKEIYERQEGVNHG